MKQVRILFMILLLGTLLGCTTASEKLPVVEGMRSSMVVEETVQEFKVKEEPKEIAQDSVMEKFKLDELAEKTSAAIEEIKTAEEAETEEEDSELYASTEKINYKGKVHQLKGDISHYGYGLHGSQTATGGRFDQWAMTTAHKTLPFGTIVKVTNKTNGKSVTVRVNDRGPYIKGRTFDLSRGAFIKIAPQSQGVLRAKDVTVRIIKLGNGNRKENR